MSGFYCTDEFGDPFAAPTPAVPPSTPVTNPFLAQGEAAPAPSPLSASAPAATKAAALPTPTSVPTPVGNPFEETDVFAQAPAVVPSPAKPAMPAPPALVVSPARVTTVAAAPVDAFFGTADLAPTLASASSGSFHAPVVAPVTGMAAMSLASPVLPQPVVTPVLASPSKAQQPASSAVAKSPVVDTSDFDPYSPAKRASISVSAASASAPVVVSSPVVPTSSPTPKASQAPAVVAEEADEEDWGIEWKAEQPTKPEATAATETKPASPVSSPSKAQVATAAAPTTTTTAAAAAPEGVCLARVTTRSIFVREWKPAFWIIINQRLWIYRSKADYKPTDYIHDPFSERIKKCIHLRDNLRVTEMKSKMYPGETKTLYTFAIEGMDEDGGKSLTAKFAAYNYDQLKALRDQVEERVWAARHVVRP